MGEISASFVTVAGDGFAAGHAGQIFALSWPSLALLAGYVAIGLVFVYALWEASEADKKRQAGQGFIAAQTLRDTIILLWVLCAACVTAWLISGRGLAELGLPDLGLIQIQVYLAPDWRAGLAWAIAGLVSVYALASSAWSVRNAQSRQHMSDVLHASKGMDMMWPKTGGEAGLFAGLAVTAGITEEIIFRGFVLVSLTMILPLWTAALASAAIFIGFHAYQGVSGMVRIMPITIVLTGLVMLSGSLWPAMMVHVLVDLSALILFWNCRDVPSCDLETIRETG